MPAALILDSLLDPVSRCFTGDSARALADVRADDSVSRRIEELAAKANEGELSESERRDYETYVHVGNVIAILQAKARLHLQRTAA